jgi:glycogen operon protein
MGLIGSQIAEPDAQGERIVGSSFLILLNAHHECVSFRLSARARDQDWELVLDTSSAKFAPKALGRLTEYELQPRSLAVLRRLQNSAGGVE